MDGWMDVLKDAVSLFHLCSTVVLIETFLVFFVLQDDPYWMVQYMSERERWLVGNQSVCSLEQMLQLAARSNHSALFTLRRPPPGHPHHLSWVNLTLTTVLYSGIPQHLVRHMTDFLYFHNLKKWALIFQISNKRTNKSLISNKHSVELLFFCV